MEKTRQKAAAAPLVDERRRNLISAFEQFIESLEVPAARRAAETASTRSPLETVDRIAEAWFEPVDSGQAIVRQAQLRRKRMEAFEGKYGLLTSSQVAELSGSRSRNRAAMAHRWIVQKKIFAVPLHGNNRFPGFQFDESGRPKTAIGQVLEELPFDPGGWDAAFWFDTPHFALPRNARPVALLDKRPDLVVEAARRTAAEMRDEWN